MYACIFTIIIIQLKLSLKLHVHPLIICSMRCLIYLSVIDKILLILISFISNNEFYYKE